MIAPLLAVLVATCPVSLQNRHGQFNYGTRELRAAIYWPHGVLPAGTLPDGSSYARVNRDGSISAKVGWWRGVPGKLRIHGQRMDGRSPPLRAQASAGYGSRGFQPSGLTFPTGGCWRVVAQVADARLTLVVRVTKLRS